MLLAKLIYIFRFSIDNKFNFSHIYILGNERRDKIIIPFQKRSLGSVYICGP